MNSATMRYFDSDIISHEICKHEIFWFSLRSHEISNHKILWCNSSQNLQLWYIVVLVQCITKSSTIKYCGYGVISHEICTMRYCDCVKYLIRSATMRYFVSGVISHGICSHGIFRFWCNISRNLQPWDILILV